MMTLATTFGLLLLLAHPQPQEMPAATFLFQTQENSPAQNPPEQPPSSEETKPVQPDKTEQPAQQPSSDTGSTDTPGNPPQEPIAKPAPQNNAPKPAKSKKTPAKISAARKPVRKRTRSKKEDSIVVVRNGGTSDSQVHISSGTSDQQASQQLKNTNSLLGATTENLQKISGKQLNLGQQDMAKQIRNYMQQSKNAAVAGDMQGANNLAVKAHLLSEELVKH